MKSLFSFLGLIAAILAVVLAILPMEKIALIPAIAAFVLGLIAFLIAKNDDKKLIKFVFFVTILALAIITYKSIFSTDSEVKTDESFIEKSKESEENALEELENLEELNTFEESDSIQ